MFKLTRTHPFYRQMMMGEDNMSDDVFEVEESVSSNVLASGLMPRVVEQPVTATPSPTGYRDYKPPAEVFAENYGYSTTTARNYADVQGSLKRTKQEDVNMTHKVSLPFP